MDPVTPKLMNWFERLEDRYAGVHFETLIIGDSRAALWPADQAAEIGPALANLGVGSERVEHILWRAINSRLDYSKVTRAVVVAGTNNITKNKNSPADTARGVRQIVEVIRSRAPRARIRTHDMYEALPRDARKYSEQNRLELNRQMKVQSSESGIFEHVVLPPMDVRNAEVFVTIPGYSILHLTPTGYLPVTAAVVSSFGG